MQYGQAPALVADVVGPLSSLFAPAKPALIPVEGVLVGCIDVAALVGAPRAVALVQRLLRCLHMIHTRKTPPLQLVYVHEFRSPRARVVVDLVVGLGVEVRALEPSDATILVEVRRPEGFMIVGLTGCKLALPGAADVRVRTLNEQKDRAEVGGSSEPDWRDPRHAGKTKVPQRPSRFDCGTGVMKAGLQSSSGRSLAGASQAKSGTYARWPGTCTASRTPMHRTTYTTATLLALLASACAAHEGRDGTGFGSGRLDTSTGSEDAPTSTIETASGESTSPATSSADASTSHEGMTSGIGTSTSASGSTSDEPGTTGEACDDPPGTPVGPTYSLGPKFQDHYAIYDLGEVPGIDACLGGALIKPTDPYNLLIIGNPGLPSAQLFKIGLTRGLCGHITGFQGSAAVVADVPQAQSILLAREDLLLITVTPSNRLYQLLNDANTPSWTYDFDVMKEVQYSASGIGIVPDSYGLPARTLCFSSWTLGAFTCGSIKTDGPLAELSGLTQLSTYSDADFGFAYVSESLDLPVFPQRSLLGSTISGVSAYRCDDDGVPIYDTKARFVDGDSLNVHIDPVRGDVLISALNSFPKPGEDPFCHLLVVRPRQLIAN